MVEKLKIKKIFAREILDSRGNPTVEVELKTESESFIASVPSGASRGKYEAKELRDGQKRYQGKGVLKAVNNINKIIAPKLKEKKVKGQKEIDEFLIKLDGTKDKSRLGANAILPVSMAFCRASARVRKVSLFQYIAKLTGVKPFLSLPRPCFNVINGGVHAGNDLDFQEFMITPVNFFSLTSKKKGKIKPVEEIFSVFQENLRMASEIYQELKKTIKEKYGKEAINVGDEGGFAPPIKNPKEVIELILKTTKELNYEEKIEIILDLAASQFFEKGKYKTRVGIFNQEKLADYYLDLIKKYSIIGLEDPFAEDDFLGWQKLNLKIKSQKSKILIIGDDLTVTNPERMRIAKEKDLCNGVIIKLNQIGTVSEAIEAVKLAKSYDWKIVVSHRSGETCDDFVADFAVGVAADFVKFGAPARGERVTKYNRLAKIEQEIRK